MNPEVGDGMWAEIPTGQTTAIPVDLVPHNREEEIER